MSILAKIVDQKRIEVEQSKDRARREHWWRRLGDLPLPADFEAALRLPGRMRVIAEIKQASPSAGILRDPFDPPAIASDYEQHGADCLSVLTDENFFQGSIDHLRAVRQVVSLPLLRKDFVIDPVQIAEARLAGASAVLLIAECLSRAELADLVGEIRQARMQPLVELYDPENLEAVLESGTNLVGINNRDLRSFVTDLSHTLDLLPRIPPDRVVVSESGIRTRDDVDRLASAGVHAILVGETFMRAPSPGAKLAELLSH
ncbi:indole-3-glycerol phosphate synthase TrpC [bacterium]|jgi:indole-3-glycerol phosphate synthase|nr:indole-3-glycerol phosphate synthase TrpC [bacterium]